MRTKPARQPEAVSTSFEGQCNPRDLAAGLDRLVAPAMQQASSLSALGSSFLRGWRSMPGSTPPTSQLDWLSSATAMIVLSWSKATRDLLKSFSWGIGALRQLFAGDDGAISFAACPIPSLRWRKADSNCWSPLALRAARSRKD